MFYRKVSIDGFLHECFDKYVEESAKEFPKKYKIEEIPEQNFGNNLL